MPYWDAVARSFRIAWTYRYLWLIAFFSGETGGNLSLSYTQTTTTKPDLATLQQQAVDWVNSHAGVISAVAVAWLAVGVGFFFLGAVCEGATIRASAEHDADRPFGLRLAWTMGMHTLWVIVRFRLLVLALYLPLVVLVVGWAFWLIIALAGGNSSLVAGLVLAGVLVLFVFLVYFTYVQLIDRYGSRAVVLEERKALQAVGRANRLLFKRFGRSLVVLLLAIAVAAAAGIALAFFSVLLFLPLFVALAATAANGSGAFWPVLAVTAAVAVPIYLVVGGFLSAQSSTYWTLAFRRLDIEYGPVSAYPAYPPGLARPS